MAYFFALITVALCALVYACAFYTMQNPDKPIWPPHKFNWGARITTWAVTIAALGSAYMAGSASWNAWGLPDWIRFYIGFLIVFIVSSFSSLAIVQMGFDQAMGANNALKTDGLFAKSRNPTYLANIGLCIGFIVLAASTPALIAAGSLCLLYYMAIPAEEAWLKRTYGADYEAYMQRTQRWL